MCERERGRNIQGGHNYYRQTTPEWIQKPPALLLSTMAESTTAGTHLIICHFGYDHEAKTPTTRGKRGLQLLIAIHGGVEEIRSYARGAPCMNSHGTRGTMAPLSHSSHSLLHGIKVLRCRAYTRENWDRGYY